MKLTNEKYRERIIDKKLEKYLKIFGGVVIEGPKWCGKTWTSLNHAESVVYLTDNNVRTLVQSDPKMIFSDQRPQLIDEWQLVPYVWDAARLECDLSEKKGNFILTGSTTLQIGDHEKVFHSGAGRFCLLKMYPMSLYESGNSNGEVSISDLFSNKNISTKVEKLDLKTLAYLIVRGGWPANINTPVEDAGIIPKSYIDMFLTRDIHERNDRKRSSSKMELILKSLARNETSTVSISTLVNDVTDNASEEETIESRNTLSDYLDVLDSLYITNNQPAFSTNYRSSSRIGKTAKRHLVDPSLACAALGLDTNKLLSDLKTFGLMFESLVYRDLCIYMDSLNGKVYHFRDNTSGDEVDIIAEASNGDYGAIEVKLALTEDSLAMAKKSLMTFYENTSKKPKFLAIVTGSLAGAYIDKETGIYILPINSLKP